MCHQNGPGEAVDAFFDRNQEQEDCGFYSEHSTCPAIDGLAQRPFHTHIYRRGSSGNVGGVEAVVRGVEAVVRGVVTAMKGWKELGVCVWNYKRTNLLDALCRHWSQKR